MDGETPFESEMICPKPQRNVAVRNQTQITQSGSSIVINDRQRWENQSESWNSIRFHWLIESAFLANQFATNQESANTIDYAKLLVGHTTWKAKRNFFCLSHRNPAANNGCGPACCSRGQRSATGTSRLSQGRSRGRLPLTSLNYHLRQVVISVNESKASDVMRASHASFGKLI